MSTAVAAASSSLVSFSCIKLRRVTYIYLFLLLLLYRYCVREYSAAYAVAPQLR